MSKCSARLKSRYKELRNSEGLTQVAIAQRLGVTPSTVGHWLNGRREPRSIDDYEKLATILKVSANWLMYGSDDKPQSKIAVFVPVLKGQQIKAWQTDKNFDMSSNGSIPIFSDNLNVHRFYAIEVIDSGLEPRICSGDFAIIDPDQIPTIGKMVAIDFADNGILSLGTLTQIGPAHKLKMCAQSFELPENYATSIYRGEVKTVIFNPA